MYIEIRDPTYDDIITLYHLYHLLSLYVLIKYQQFLLGLNNYAFIYINIYRMCICVVWNRMRQSK